MLNGKFYTGLPPKMVERQAVKVCNRQESHFFWPDDSRADSAVETRAKRRNSQQLEKPVDAITSNHNASDEVDTRRMFHKEFASSSIQFYDNLQSNPGNKPSAARGLRREITPKLTEVRPQESDSKAENTNTNSRRQQAYSSKIQFYDYVNEADNARRPQNNARRPQMDFNDKREVELNSKNSPKLQVKGNVRSFSVELEPKVTKKPLNDSPEWRRPRPLPLPLPKRILKQRAQEQDTYDHVEDRVRRLQLTRSPGLPKKHVTYNEEAAEYAYYDDREDREAREDREEPSYESRPRQQPNMPTGSRQQQQQQQQQRSFMETSRTKPLNNNNSYEANGRGRKILPKMPQTRQSGVAHTHTIDEEPPVLPVPSDPRKHLRSSLCFSGDALMVGGTASQSPPTAQARRSSAGQRVSVGLPD